MRGLYAIVDVDFLERRGLELASFARRLVAARPAALQLRAKSWGSRRVLEALCELVPLCEARGVPSFANDRPDLALLAGCRGVHLGQDDLPLADARALAPKLSIGISTHSLEQVREALEQAPSYVALGPLYATRSKVRPDPVVSAQTLAAASRLCRRRGVPLVGIGGLTLERLEAVRERLDAWAVISGVCPGGTLEEVEPTARLWTGARESPRP